MIKVKDSKKGRGSELLKWVCDIADEYNIEIHLNVEDKFGVPYEKLYSWYSKFGFKTDGENYMIRYKKSDRNCLINKDIINKIYDNRICLMEILNDGINDDGFTKANNISMKSQMDYLINMLNTYKSKDVYLADLKFLYGIIENILGLLDFRLDDEKVDDKRLEVNTLMLELETVLNKHKI